LQNDTKQNPNNKKDSLFDFGRWKNKKRASLILNALLVVILLGAVFISHDPFAQNQTPTPEQQTQTALNPQDERDTLTETSQTGPAQQESSSKAPDNQTTTTGTVAQQSFENATEAVAVEGKPEIWLPPANAGWDRNYGYGLDPTFDDYRFHKGCDMTLEIGQPVLATAEGTVKSISTDPLWGDMITLAHGGGFTSVYMGINAAELKVGQAIAAGDNLGTVSASPKAEQAQQPHLHFELYLNGVSQDPLIWMNQ